MSRNRRRRVCERVGVAYLIGFAAMVPFFSTPKFTAPIARGLYDLFAAAI